MDINMVLKAVGISLCLAVLLVAHLGRLLSGGSVKSRAVLLVAICAAVFVTAEFFITYGLINLWEGTRHPAVDPDILTGAGFVLVCVFALLLPGNLRFIGRKSSGAGELSGRKTFFFYFNSLLIAMFAAWAACSLAEFRLPFPVTGAALAVVALLIGLDTLRIESIAQRIDLLEMCGVLLVVSGIYLTFRPFFPSGLQDSNAKLFVPQGQETGTVSMLVLGVLFLAALWVGYYFNKRKRGCK